MGMRMAETCSTVFKRQAINLRDWCIWLVDLFEYMMMHGLTKPKFGKMFSHKLDIFKRTYVTVGISCLCPLARLPQDELINTWNILQTKTDGCTSMLSVCTMYSLHRYTVKYTTMRNWFHSHQVWTPHCLVWNRRRPTLEFAFDCEWSQSQGTYTWLDADHVTTNTVEHLFVVSISVDRRMNHEQIPALFVAW